MAKMYKVWCEWDMGWNIDDYTGVYTDEKELYEHLESINWKSVGYSDYKEVMDDGLLTVDEMEG